jgi:hypothetical protein
MTLAFVTTSSHIVAGGRREKVSRITVACQYLPFTEDHLGHTMYDGLNLFRHFTVPPRLRRGVSIKLLTGLALNISRYAADYFGIARVLMAMRFHALIVTIAMINSASSSSPNRRLASS